MKAPTKKGTDVGARSPRSSRKPAHKDSVPFVEPGQSGSYGTDRVREGFDGSVATTHTPAPTTQSNVAGGKVDTGAAPSVGSSPSRQR